MINALVANNRCITYLGTCCGKVPFPTPLYRIHHGTPRRAKGSGSCMVEMAEGEEGSLQEAVEESEQPFDPPVEQVNLPDFKQAFYLNSDHIRERDENGNEEVLGEGAFGRVTKVYWSELPCAAKELRDDLDILTEENRKRATKGFFVESLQLAGRLRHPNIVQYIGLWRRPNGNDVILMELLPRKSLTHFLHNSKTRIPSIPLCVKHSILIDVCCAMIYLHNQQPCVLHRDLTSNNILLTSDFRAKVTDFGQARFYTDANQEKLTRQPGTKMFMPPEVLLPEPKYGKPLDRFNFGCVTLQMPAEHQNRPPMPWEDRKHLHANPAVRNKITFSSQSSSLVWTSYRRIVSHLRISTTLSVTVEMSSQMMNAYTCLTTMLTLLLCKTGQ